MTEATRGDEFAEAFRKALTASRRRRRGQRWKRKRGLATVAGPGMVRILPAAAIRPQ